MRAQAVEVRSYRSQELQNGTLAFRSEVEASGWWLDRVTVGSPTAKPWLQPCRLAHNADVVAFKMGRRQGSIRILRVSLQAGSLCYF
jgi:hypothetical protein